MNNFDYENLTPFKWFVLENFPFIEEDFDALTNWQLFCKLGKEINKIINSENILGEQVENITNGFITLENYVNNYFNNLDVQEEINNKLDSLAQDGTLTQLISQYLNSAAVQGFNTVNDMKNGETLVNGSFAKTYGYSVLNDGDGAFYKIRNITNQDVVDNVNIIALTNTNLVAEKIKENLKNYVFIGDSYNTTITPEGGVPIVPWGSLLKNMIPNNRAYVYGEGGIGWARPNNATFIHLLQSVIAGITDKPSITDIVVLGGINDITSIIRDEITVNSIYDAIVEFSNYCKTNFPNAIITIGFISNTKGSDYKNQIKNILPIYNKASRLDNVRVIENIYTCYHNYTYSQPDMHPNSDGSYAIAEGVANFLKNGNINTIYNYTNQITISDDNELGMISGTKFADVVETLNNGFVTLKLDVKYLIRESGITLRGETKYKLGTMPNKLIYGSTTSPLRISYGICVAYTGNNTFHLLNYILTLEDDNVYISFRNYVESGVINVANVNQIFFSPLPDINISALNC